MQVLQERNGALELLRRKDYKYEKDLQALCEANLGVLFGLEFVKSQFTVKEFRIDTLAFDPEASAFVVVEYKRDSSFHIVDQGLAYLNVLRANPAECILTYSEQLGKQLSKGDVNWDRSRVHFVAPSYTAHQRAAVSVRDFPMDLWEIGVLEGGIITLQHVGDGIVAQRKEISDVERLEQGGQAGPTVGQHLDGCPPDVRELYLRLSAEIKGFGNVTERPITVAVLFESDAGRFAEVVFQKKQLVVHFDYFDGDHRGLAVRDLEGLGVGRYYAVGPYQIKIHPGDNLDPVIELLRASYSGVAGVSIGSPSGN